MFASDSFLGYAEARILMPIKDQRCPEYQKAYLDLHSGNRMETKGVLITLYLQGFFTVLERSQVKPDILRLHLALGDRRDLFLFIRKDAIHGTEFFLWDGSPKAQKLSDRATAYPVEFTGRSGDTFYLNNQPTQDFDKEAFDKKLFDGTSGDMFTTWFA